MPEGLPHSADLAVPPLGDDDPDARESISLLEPNTIESQKSLTPQDFKAAGDWGIQASRLAGGLSAGVDTIEVSNGKLNFVVLPTHPLFGAGHSLLWYGTHSRSSSPR